MEKKKKSRYSNSKIKRRDQDQYPALNKGLNLKSRQDEIDVDYLHKLTPQEAAWLDKFNEEYVNAGIVDRKDYKFGDSTKNIHSTLKLKQSVDKRNNERKECLYTREKASGNLKFAGDLKEKSYVIDDYEDRLIDKIEKKKLY